MSTPPVDADIRTSVADIVRGFLADPSEFAVYLASIKLGDSVGRIMSCEACPLAHYLDDRLRVWAGGLPNPLCPKTVQVSREYVQFAGETWGQDPLLRLPAHEWPSRFVALMDSSDIHEPISPALALLALEMARKPQLPVHWHSALYYHAGLTGLPLGALQNAALGRRPPSKRPAIW
jgi:hypothetical protein